MDMKRREKHIAVIFLFISMLMLVASVIPHHHDAKGAICMKQDTTAGHQCPLHHDDNHLPTDNSCCHADCLTRFDSPLPSTTQPDSDPHYLTVTILFTDMLIEQLLRPQEKQSGSYFVYKDSPYDSGHHASRALRAPPALLSV